MFQIGAAPHHEVPNTPLVNAILDGRYDDLFGKDSGLSRIVIEAEQPPPPPPSVQVVSILPFLPVSTELPVYPPIAIAARVEGIVRARFDVTTDGKTKNIAFDDETNTRMLQEAVRDAISKWSFPQPAWGQNGKAAIEFNLNCHDDSR